MKIYTNIYNLKNKINDNRIINKMKYKYYPNTYILYKNNKYINTMDDNIIINYLFSNKYKYIYKFINTNYKLFLNNKIFNKFIYIYKYNKLLSFKSSNKIINNNLFIYNNISYNINYFYYNQVFETSLSYTGVNIYSIIYNLFNTTFSGLKESIVKDILYANTYKLHLWDENLSDYDEFEEFLENQSLELENNSYILNLVDYSNIDDDMKKQAYNYYQKILEKHFIKEKSYELVSPPLFSDLQTFSYGLTDKIFSNNVISNEYHNMLHIIRISFKKHLLKYIEDLWNLETRTSITSYEEYVANIQEKSAHLASILFAYNFSSKNELVSYAQNNIFSGSFFETTFFEDKNDLEKLEVKPNIFHDSYYFFTKLYENHVEDLLKNLDFSFTNLKFYLDPDLNIIKSNINYDTSSIEFGMEWHLNDEDRVDRIIYNNDKITYKLNKRLTNLFLAQQPFLSKIIFIL